ncbi:GNAT family N-acetyltransferase [Paenibacillus ginsengarvi]|uniref:N-acetyltransferase n=1 Tax=Paenibacillus ginsengarvi TaxID=400777 RepID=A0A3B0CFH5_9BACL|nr:GNAT family N-acetyltransferase [Paenibacillus ginsengarvi]RKN84353.1 N-acetyltransferase [Paenibacillus ginsengarvi]
MESYYKLDEQLELKQADSRAFAIHYTAYRENVFFRQSWDRRVAIFGEEPSCYWITSYGRKIGGVCLKPNSMWALFLIPPFTDLFQVLIPLKRLLRQCADFQQDIQVYGILPYQKESFLRLGFRPTEARRVMIRPTELFAAPKWGEDVVAKPPDASQLERIAELFVDCYGGDDGIGYPAPNTLADHSSALEYYFSHNDKPLLRDASTILYDKQSGEMIAACLVSVWEDLPLFSDIAVRPAYRGQHCATGMLKKAITALHSHYEVVRLFVTIGNPAESLYYGLGFYPGLEQTTFRLPVRA